MNKKYKYIKLYLKILLFSNLIFSQTQYNHPYGPAPFFNFVPMVDSNGEELVTSNSVAFSWNSPDKEKFGPRLVIREIDDEGNGEVSFSVAFDLIEGTSDYFFAAIKGFNFAFNSTNANFVITGVSGGITEEEEWTVINQGSNIIYASNIVFEENEDGEWDQIEKNPIYPMDDYGHDYLFTVHGTYEYPYSHENNDGIVYIEHIQQETNFFTSNEFEPLADYQFLPARWSPGINYTGQPENINCECTNDDFYNCPYECLPPFEYNIYRFEFEDLNDNYEFDEDFPFNESSIGDTVLIGTTTYQQESYDQNNDTHTYFEDLGLISEHGYCYYVTASDPSIFNGQTHLTDAYDRKMCIKTDCITDYYYEDLDQDGLGDPDGATQEAVCGAPDSFVNNQNDYFPDCPNFEGNNPKDCANKCFDWNIIESFDFGNSGTWRLLFEDVNGDGENNSDLLIDEYEDMKEYFCSDAEHQFYPGCAIDENIASDNPWACPGYCANDSPDNLPSSYTGITGDTDGHPEYEFSGARNCAGLCNYIECINEDDGICVQRVMHELAATDNCGWCCSCTKNDADGMYNEYFENVEDDEGGECTSTECSFYSNGAYGGHRDCSGQCWSDIPNSSNPQVFEDSCGICDGPDACGSAESIEYLTATTLEDNITIELNWDSPSFYQSQYSYIPDIAVYINDIIVLEDDISTPGQDIEISLGMENKDNISGFNIKVKSELLIFYDNQGYGGRAEDAGVIISITSNNSEDVGYGQIFASIVDNPIGSGEGLLTKFKASINPYNCLDNNSDEICDKFLGEEFIDTNNDLIFNQGESFTDLNDNCKWDRKEEFHNDVNGNGSWDPGDVFIECNEDQTLCESCDEYSNSDNCRESYHPLGEDETPGGGDDCYCNEVGICMLNKTIYEEQACLDFYNLCLAEEELECMGLNGSDVWLVWNNNMADGIWNDEEEYSDLNGNQIYDPPEYFMDYGLDGCPDILEDGSGGCNEVENQLAYFDDPNNDNNIGENNCQYDNYIIDNISHIPLQTSFSDIFSNSIDDYIFLNTKWNINEMVIEQVGIKGDNFCYNSVECGALEYESHYSGFAEDCPPLIAYEIIRNNSLNSDEKVLNQTHYIDIQTEYDSEYCYTINSQVIYDPEAAGIFDEFESCELTDPEDWNLFNPGDADNYMNNGTSIEACANTGCQYTTMFHDGDFDEDNNSDGFGDPDSSQNICIGGNDGFINFVTNSDDLWPNCFNELIDVSPYDCNDECNGISIEGINGICCPENELDDCSICYGNGSTCAGLDAPQLIATGSDDSINLEWNEVSINNDNNRNDRELLNLSVLEIDDLEYDDNCGPEGNGQECIGRMSFLIQLDNYDQSINDFNIEFNTNSDYALDTIATYFFGVSVFNQGLVFWDDSNDEEPPIQMNMNIGINESNIFVQSSGPQIRGSGELIYVSGTYDLSLTGESIYINTNPSQTVFLDSLENEINYSFLPTLWTVGEDFESACDNDGVCEEGESFFNCPDDCEGITSYTLRRDGNIIASGIEGTTYVDDEGLEEGITYCYIITATSHLITSAPSEEVCSNLECSNANTYYYDQDGDGYGDPESTIEDCVIPEGYVENADDSWPDCSNSELDVDPYDCAGLCEGEAELDECGVCNGDGLFEQECWSDENLDGCYETSMIIETCACEDEDMADEGDGSECEGEQPQPEAPLYLAALGGYHQIELGWQVPDLSLREVQELQIVINNIVDDGVGNVIFSVNMSNPEPVESFNLQVQPSDDIFIIESVGGGSSEQAGMNLDILSENLHLISGSGGIISSGNGLFFNINASYDVSNIDQIINLGFDNIGFNNNSPVSWIPSNWIIGTGIQSTPLYCGDDICDENENINDSCPEDCNFTYIIQIDNVWVEQDYTELSYIHSDLGLGEEHCYKVYAELNEEIVVISPLVCATSDVNNLPVIISIEDQPEDDGGVVILSIEPINLDSEPQGYFYEIYRQFNEGSWVSVDLFGAYGSDLYTVVTTTVADMTTDDDGDVLYNEHNFKVRFLNFESNIVSGYSINNLAPDPPIGLVLDTYGDILIELDWDSNTELDLGYYSVYSRTENTDWIVIEDTDDSHLMIDIPSEIMEFVITASDTTGNESEFSSIVSTGELNFDISGIPKEFTLYPAYPNPFNPITNIQYGLSEPAYVGLEIYDIMGRSVAELINTFKPAGIYEISWNADNYNSGLYLIKLSTGSKVLTQKILLIK